MRIVHLIILLLFISTCQAQTLVIGVPGYAPPFVFETGRNNEFSGFSIDIMKNICKRLKVSCQFKPMNFYQVITDVQKGLVDMGAGDFTITQNRQKYLLFSHSLMPSYVQFVSLKRSNIHTLQDLRGKTVGSEMGPLINGIAKTQFQGDITLINYPRISRMMHALVDKKVDAACADAATLEYWVNNNPALFRLINPPLQVGKGYGFFTTKQNQLLIKQINQALTDMHLDGTYLEIYKLYFGLGA